LEPSIKVIIVPLLIALGALIPWVGLPVYVVIKNDHKRNAKILLVASIIGVGLWIAATIYGWHHYKETFPRNPNY
ncbi:MAG: hypothetical protein ACOC1L_05370, partial [Bacillota bacterium]